MDVNPCIPLQPTSAAAAGDGGGGKKITDSNRRECVRERERIGFATVNVSTQRVACSLAALLLAAYEEFNN